MFLQLVKMHLATLWARRGSLFIAGFVFGLLLIALAFGGWLDDQGSALTASWLSLALYAYGAFALVAGENKRRLAFFVARAESGAFLQAQGLAVLLSFLPFFLIWGLVFVQFSDPMGFPWAAVAAQCLFVLVFLQAMQGIYRMLGLLKIGPMVYVLISGPWLLVAWLIGLYASTPHADTSFALLALGALAVFYAIADRV